MYALQLQSFLDDYNETEIQDDHIDRVSDYSQDLNEELNLLSNNRRGEQWED